ncbi:MAG TPA: hypothetical protein VLT36_17145, partial [Candidatus Dormibacteraeota bacterium]|nr:hypothetical protein [Candidatus Dormibacteraeota bacterium]
NRNTKPKAKLPDVPLASVPLTSYPGIQQFPSFSPEGSRIAFSWEEPGKHPSGIYVKLIGSGEPVRLTSGGTDLAPAWSPDGRSIAFLRILGHLDVAVMIVPAIGGPLRKLASLSFETDFTAAPYAWEPSSPFLAWSPNGKWLLALDQVGPNKLRSIIRISPETGEKRTLTFPAPGNRDEGGDAGLALSPDGKMLAFSRAPDPPDCDIYIVPVSQDLLPAGAPTLLFSGGKEVSGLAWMPGSRELIFSSTRRGKPELWKMSVRERNDPVLVNVSADGPRTLAISQASRRLVYSHVDVDQNIWRMALTGKDKGQTGSFLSSTRHDSRPSYSPDGKRIAFESGRSGSEEIWVCNDDSSGCIQLTSFGNAWAGTPRWSPDGRNIAFDCNAAGNWNVYAINAEGGRPLRLTSDPATEIEPIWSADGKWIYYCSGQTGGAETWKTPAAGGAHIKVTANGGCGAFESQDGKYLYYSNGQGFWKMPTPNGDQTRVSSPLSQWAFSPAARGAYFIDGGKLLANVKFLDFKTHAIRTIAAIHGRLADGISVSPDGKWLLYTQVDTASSELMLVDNFH